MGHSAGLPHIWWGLAIVLALFVTLDLRANQREAPAKWHPDETTPLAIRLAQLARTMRLAPTISARGLIAPARRVGTSRRCGFA
jgi:hypothetical protein